MIDRQQNIGLKSYIEESFKYKYVTDWGTETSYIVFKLCLGDLVNHNPVD